MSEFNRGKPASFTDIAFDTGRIYERDVILDRTYDDETMHNIWWLIKREDRFPTQEFIADVIREYLLIKGVKSE